MPFHHISPSRRPLHMGFPFESLESRCIGPPWGQQNDGKVGSFALAASRWPLLFPGLGVVSIRFQTQFGSGMFWVLTVHRIEILYSIRSAVLRNAEALWTSLKLITISKVFLFWTLLSFSFIFLHFPSPTRCSPGWSFTVLRLSWSPLSTLSNMTFRYI